MAPKRRLPAYASYSLVLCAPLAFSLGLYFAGSGPAVAVEAAPVVAMQAQPEVVIVPVPTFVAMPVEQEASGAADIDVATAEPSEWTEETEGKPSHEPGAFIFVRDGELVLAEGVDGAAWGRGDVRGTVRDEIVARRTVDMQRLPAGYADLLHASIDLYDAEGKVCSVEIESFELVARYHGEEHYIDEDETISRTEQQSILDDVFASDDTWLVADFTATGGCADALWGRDSSLPTPRILHEIDAPAVERAGRALFRASSWYQGAAETYSDYIDELGEGERDSSPSWKRFTRKHLKTTVWADEETRTPELFSLDFGDPDSSCGDGFWESMSVSYALDEVAALTEHAHTPLPDAVFDLEGDGNLELLYTFDEGVALATGDREQDREAAVYWDGCPC